MLVKTGETLCTAHQTQLPECPECHTRVQTPAALETHLTKPLCPVLKKRQKAESQAYYEPSVNGPPAGVHAHVSESRPTNEAVEDLQASLQAMLPRLESQLQPPELGAPADIPEAAAIQSAWSDARDSSLRMEAKHFPQLACLAAHALAPTSDASRESTVLELGAGRAYLSLYLAHALSARGRPARVIAVDRSSSRMKADRTLHAWVRAGRIASFRRLTIDVRDLNVCRLDECAKGGIVYIVGKHVCGSGLDLSLTAALMLARGRDKGSVRLVLASCCRRLCRREAFGEGGRVWRECALGEADLQRVLRGAHWGLDDNHTAEMARVGHRCRKVVDGARVRWLNSVGWDARLGTYSNQTPENACIVATWMGDDGNKTETSFLT